MLNNYTLHLNYLWKKIKSEKINWVNAEKVIYLNPNLDEKILNYDGAIFEIKQEWETEEDIINRIFNSVKEPARFGDLMKVEKEDGEEVYGVLFTRRL